MRIVSRSILLSSARFTALLPIGLAGLANLVEVYQLWRQAAVQGHPAARQNLEFIGRMPGQEQLAAAQTAVAERIRGTQSDGRA